MNLFVAGGAGFIGANFAHLATRRGHTVVIYDALTYAGNPRNIEGLAQESFAFVHADIRDRARVESEIRAGFGGVPFDAIVNFAAESHVDRSISEALPFVESNVLGAITLLEAGRKAGVPVFVQISTDEVYGSIDGGRFTRESPLRPSSAYSASKAAADHLVLSFYHTHGYDVRVTRCTNNYGRFQYPEKLIPTVIGSAVNGRSIPIFGNGTQVRDWIYVDDHCEGVLAMLERGVAGKIYHFGAAHGPVAEITNLELVEMILERIASRTGMSLTEMQRTIQHVADRLGHDQRYALDWGDSHGELGWTPKVDLRTGLTKTIDWYLEHPTWWEQD